MILLKKAEPKDEAFLESVYRSTREEELKLTGWSDIQKDAFIHMQFKAQYAEYKTRFTDALVQIIVFKKKNAGRFYTWEGEKEIRLLDITILPQFRGKGIGTYLLKELVKKGDTYKKKISLHVESHNPALQLYVRLGFIHISNNGRHYYMEREPENS